MTENAREATHCYVGIAACDCRRAVVVDMPDNAKQTAKTVAEFLREGLRIERMTIEDFRRIGLSLCECAHETRQQAHEATGQLSLLA